MPKRRAARAAVLTRAAHRAGVRIAAGTDAIGSDSAGTMPNLHEELALLVEQAGLSPMNALVAGTRNAADLLVLTADPTADIRNTRAIGLVIRRGRVLKRVGGS